MKVLQTEISWDYPDTLEIPAPYVFDYSNDKHLDALILSLGNGIFIECVYEIFDNEAYKIITGALEGIGGSIKIESSNAISNLWLYRKGYDCYQQGNDTYFFVNPEPRPELFEKKEFSDYLSEFNQSKSHRSKVKKNYEDALIGRINNNLSFKQKLKNTVKKLKQIIFNKKLINICKKPNEFKEKVPTFHGA
jgi:hypothetical protein